MSTARTVEALLHRPRAVTFAALAMVILGSWIYLLTGAGTGMYPHEMATLLPSTANGPAMSAPLEASAPAAGAAASKAGAAPAMGGMLIRFSAWTAGHALLMFFMWWLMMIAMMLPSAAPMVLLHAAVSRKSYERLAADARAEQPHPSMATAVFTATYLVAWGAFSAIATLIQWGLERSGLLSGMMTSTSTALGAGILIAAGLWQLTPLKHACLRHCRSPIGFISSHWRPGLAGAFRMGLEHGTFCLGCCWFLMLLLFYGGVMNLYWIIGLALFVLVEKIVPAGARVGQLAGLLLVAWGGWLAFAAAG